MSNNEQFFRTQIKCTQYFTHDTNMYVRAALKWRDVKVPANEQAPLYVHLHVSEFERLPHGRHRLVSEPESKDFLKYLGRLVDPQGVIPEILSHVGYNDLRTMDCWKQELTNFAITVGQEALDDGVAEMELTIEIQIHKPAVAQGGGHN